ncbi:MAG: hypothetical protein ACXU9B_03185 [Reyranella sp.]
MTLPGEAAYPKQVWIDTFLAYVRRELPEVPAHRLVAAAEGLRAKLGDIDPADVAEAAWEILPLDDAAAVRG